VECQCNRWDTQPHNDKEARRSHICRTAYTGRDGIGVRDVKKQRNAKEYSTHILIHNFFFNNNFHRDPYFNLCVNDNFAPH
jgi:hypothetical protein